MPRCEPQGYDPELERQLIALGERPTVARKMTRFFGRLLGKLPETESDWEELIDDWHNITGYGLDVSKN